MTQRKVLVLGVTGVVGLAAARRFARDPTWSVVGAARRSPDRLDDVECVRVDLQDRAQAAEALGAIEGVTHVVYAALFEKPGLLAGWRERDQMETNLAMLRNALDPVLAASPVEHVTLFQGTKAYGAHVEPMRVPGRERNPRHQHENFYWLQEDELVGRADEAGFGYTILRPVVVFGEALGANMNPIPALGTYAASLRDDGEPLHYPGGVAGITEAIDADLLADVVHWVAQAPGARNQTFNVANGDVFSLENVWPTIADAFGMEVGEHRPMRLADEMPRRASQWRAIHDRFGLRSPADIDEFVGQSFIYLDMLAGYGNDRLRPASLVSTIKLRQAGFGSCMDTEDMFRKWIAHHQRIGYFPPRDP